MHILIKDEELMVTRSNVFIQPTVQNKEDTQFAIT